MKQISDKKKRKTRGRSRTVRKRQIDNNMSTSPSDDNGAPSIHNKKRDHITKQKYLPSSSTIVILISCIIFSLIVTLLILHQVGFKDEVQYVIDEAMVQTKHTLQDIYTHSSMTLSSIMSLWVKYKGGLKRSNEVMNEFNTTFEIYELHNLHPLCKEKNAFSLEQTEIKQQLYNENINIDEQCRNIITSEMKTSFEQDGVIAIRGLLSPDLFRGLNESSYAMVEQQLKKVDVRSSSGTHVIVSSSLLLNIVLVLKTMPFLFLLLHAPIIISSGKQFFLSKMGAAFTNDDYNINGSDFPSSGFRNVALSSIIPQVAAELLNLHYDANEYVNNNDQSNNEVNLRMLR